MRIATRIIILLSIVSLLTSVIFFAFHNKWLDTWLERQRTNNTYTHNSYSSRTSSIPEINKQKIDLYYWHNRQIKHEYSECLYNSKKQVVFCEQVINKWLQVLDEEDITHVRSTLQTCSILPNNQELLISFNRSFLPGEWPTYDKLMLIESLFKTVKKACPTLNFLRFMVQHENMQDAHLDFSRSWPLASFTEKQGSLNTDMQTTPNSYSLLNKQNPIIVLDPAGDAQYLGRVVGDMFERAQALHFAETIKKELEASAPNAHVVLTRAPGQIKDPFQVAALANTLNADLYISLNFYPAKEKQELRFSLFYALYDPAEEHAQNKAHQTKSIPYNYAYRTKHARLSKAIAEDLYRILSETSNITSLLVQQPLGIPFKALIPVTQPACACEIAVGSQAQCYTLAKHFAYVLKKILAKG